MGTDIKQRADLIISILFTLLLLCLPLDAGPTLKYIISGLIIVACVYSMHDDKITAHLLFIILKKPLTWMLLLYAAAGAVSIFMSIKPAYSATKFFDEFFLNLSLFSAMTLFCATRGLKIPWLRLILIANAVFLALYLGLMCQWILHPDHRWLTDTEFGVGAQSAWDIIFRFGNFNLLVHGIKHTSFFLMLGIAVSFVPLLWNRNKIINILMTGINMLTLISTTRRSPMLATVISVGLAGILNRDSAKKTLIASGIALMTIIIIATSMYFSGRKDLFVREDWGKMLQGDIASQDHASIPIRLMCLKNYSEEIMKHPFTGVGLGKKNIKEAYPELTKRTRAVHPHNIFLGLACETGIQGPITLILVIAAQAAMYWKCFKFTKSENVKIIMATALVYMLMFWLAQMATYAFHHGTSTLYWLFMAIPTGYAISEESTQGTSHYN